MHVRWLFAPTVLVLSCSSPSIDRIAKTDPGRGTDGAVPSTGGASGKIVDASSRPIDVTTDRQGLGGFEARHDGAPCASLEVISDYIGVSLYVLVDSSELIRELIPGKTTTWWDEVSAGIKTFTLERGATGNDVGIQYFPLQNPDGSASCRDDYATPDVEIATLPGNAAPIARSLDAHQSGFGRPTGPALEGAMNHLRARFAADGGYYRIPTIALLTRGDPDMCQPSTVTGLKTLAAGPDGGLRVSVYTIALGATARSMLDVGDGSPDLFYVPGGDVEEAVRVALFRAMYPPPPIGACSFDVPFVQNGPPLDFDRVSVWIESLLFGHVTIPMVASSADCDRVGAGWYFAGPDARRTIELCRGACNDLPGRPHIAFGCRY